MALSANELNIIHLRNLATPGKKYYGDDERVYIGTDSKRLRLLENSNVVVFNPTEKIPEFQVQLAIESLSTDIDNTNIVVNNNLEYTNIELNKLKCLTVAMSLIL